MSNIKGYKVFNSDWTCRGFQYKVGETFKHNGNIELCGSGFHFCQKASDCFNYYSFDSKNKVAEVLAIGNVETNENKSVTDEITIIREITWNELLNIVNEGNDCTGLCNTGDCNTGNRNTGDRNTGNRNTGYCNTGNWNTGNRNTGYCNTGNYNTGNYNTGDCNTGSWNTGDYNTGDYNTGYCNTGLWNTGNWNTGYCNTVNYNTGDWNITNYSTGLFNTKEEKIKIFDKISDWTLRDWYNSNIKQILKWNFENSVWVYEENMTDGEKKEHPEYKTTGGYLKVFDFKEACKNMWNNLTEEEKNKVITELPNFDADKFNLITGIDVNKNNNN